MPILESFAGSSARGYGFTTATGIVSDMVLLSTNTLSSATSAVTFSNLNTYSPTYRHLRLVVTARASNNNTAQSTTLEFNASAAANYSAQSFYTFITASVVANTWIYSSVNSANAFSGGAEGLTAYPSAFQPNIYELHNFAATDKNKYSLNMNGMSLTDTSGAGGGSIAFNNVMWNQTTALTSLTFNLATNYSVGTRFSLYGLKG